MTVAMFVSRLRDGAHAGPYLAPDDVPALLDAVRQSGLALVRVDLAKVCDKAALLAALASAMRFPHWFGGNWDALEECLADLPDTPYGYVLLLDHCARWAEHAPDDFAMALQIFRDVARAWSGRGKGFWTLIGGIAKPVPGLPRLS